MSAEIVKVGGPLAKGMTHPDRAAIFEELRKASPQSPARLAEALDLPLVNVSYHVKVLVEIGAIELVGTQPVRGAVEHLYSARATVCPRCGALTEATS